MFAKTDSETVKELRRLVLMGFMGSGKTTVGRLLAARLGWRFADLDNSIEELLGVSVPVIFAEQGERAFRAAETDALRELITGSRIVIALGGGATETPSIRALLAGAPETAIVWLQADFDTLHQRCARQSLDPQAAARPLLGTPEELLDRFNQRQASYESLATCTIGSHPGTPQDVLDRILAKLGPQLL